MSIIIFVSTNTFRSPQKPNNVYPISISPPPPKPLPIPISPENNNMNTRP